MTNIKGQLELWLARSVESRLFTFPFSDNLAMKTKPKPELVGLAGQIIRGLRREKGMTVAELAKAAGVSKNSVSNIEHGVTQQMKHANAERIAKALGVPLDEITIKTSIEAKNPALGSLGLIEIPASAPDDEPFQSLKFTRINQPLGDNWYDYRTESFSLHETEDEHSGGTLLECRFGGGKSSMASNFSLHPENHTPRELTVRQVAIGFSAKIVDNPLQSPLTLAVRLVDRKGREWVLGSQKAYGLKDQPYLFSLDVEGGWTQCIIDLTPYPTALHKWYLFRTTSADRAQNLRPDWTVIARAVVEIGESADIGHPAAHEGVIQFTPIWIGTHASLANKLPVGSEAQRGTKRRSSAKGEGRVRRGNSRSKRR